MFLERLQDSLLAIIISISVCVLYFYFGNFVIRRFSMLPMFTGRKQEQVRSGLEPWVFLAPAIIFLTLFLVYPVIETVILSFYDEDGTTFVGLSNYNWAFSNEEFFGAIRNNIIWLIITPTLSTIFGLLIAVLTDRLWWGTLARIFIFMPMAISFVGAGVIWKFVYDYRPIDQVQIGILNAIVTGLGYEPQAWLTIPFWNNFFLIAILIWIQTGFAMVVLAAALRGVPYDTIEAALVEGATPRQIFFRITLPQIFPSVLMVWTTITILVLKVFDIVLAMTNGQWDTEVLANLMYSWMFRGGTDFGRGSMIAVVIMVAVIPVMIWNIRNALRNSR